MFHSPKIGYAAEVRDVELQRTGRRPAKTSGCVRFATSTFAVDAPVEAAGQKTPPPMATDWTTCADAGRRRPAGRTTSTPHEPTHASGHSAHGVDVRLSNCRPAPVRDVQQIRCQCGRRRTGGGPRPELITDSIGLVQPAVRRDDLAAKEVERLDRRMIRARARPPPRRSARRRPCPTGAAAPPRTRRTGRRRRSRDRARPIRAAGPRAPARGTRRTPRPGAAAARGRSTEIRCTAGRRRAPSRSETRIGWPFSRAPCPRSAVNSSSADRVVDDADLERAVDLERDRHAEERQAVREVRGAVERIDDPAAARRRRRRGAPAAASSPSTE